MAVDRERARDLFADEELAWLIDRLRTRLERRRPLEGRLRLDAPTEGQRDALERLVGRRPRTARSISVEVAELAEVLRRAGIADELGELVEAVGGPLVDRVARAEEERQRWEAVHRSLRAAASDLDPSLVGWAEELEGSGLLRRLARTPEVAEALTDQVLRVLAALPGDGVPLAELAAATLGDSHALDDDRPVATLVLRAIEMRSGLPRRDRSAAERRALWARAGVLRDELSAPVLVLNLRPAGDGVVARTLRLHADAGEPYRATLRQLVRHPPDWRRVGASAVAVCENPTVLAAVAERLGPGAPPLVCTDGQPSGAVQTLLRALVEAGVSLRFHADLDAGGIRIGNLLVDRFGAEPWRMRTTDYEAAAHRGPPLRRVPDVALWDADLAPAMAARGRAVHEEQVLDLLLADLERWPSHR